MAEFNVLKYTIKIDKQTKAVQQVNQELKSVEQQTGRIGTAAGKTSGAFSSLGGIVKGLGIAAILATVTTQAFKGSDALQQMVSEMLSMISTITKELEPAFKVLTRAVKGFSATLTATISVVKNLLKGDFKAAWNDTLNGAADALAGFAGQSEIVMKKTVDNMLSELVRDLKSTKLTGEQKLALLDQNEEKLMKLLKETGDFRQADRDTQRGLEENFLRVFATEREAAEREMLNQTAKNAQARLKLAQVMAQQAIADEEATTEQKLEALQAAFDIENEVIDANAAQRFESDEAIAAAKLQARLKFTAQTEAIQNAELKKIKDFAKARIAGAANAAAQELLVSKNAGSALRAAGAQTIKDAANSAAKVISVKGAEATARAFARGGGFPTGIPFAVATAAAYTALAATVSAAGGAAAAAVAPPSGGGAAAAPVAAEGPLGTPAPVTTATTGDGGGGGVPAAAGPGGGGALTIIIDRLIIENVSDVRYIDILMDSLNKAVQLRGGTLVASVLR